MTNRSIIAEGFSGDVQKKKFVRDAWKDIYAARQNDTIMQEKAVAVEEHELNGKKVPCLVVRIGHIKGLIPFNESGEEKERHLRRMIGQTVAFKIAGFDRETELVVLSRKRAKEHMARVAWDRLKEGEPTTCVARVVTNKQALVDIGGITVSLPAEEIQWGWTHDVRDVLQEGDVFDVLVTEIDEDKETIKVSLKRTLPCPWPDAALRYIKGNDYLGTVSGIVDYGVFVNLEPGVDALSRHMKFDRPNIGDEVIYRVTGVDAKGHKIKGYIKEIKRRVNKNPVHF